MPARVRSHDWAATPLGSPDGWPQNLRNAVSLALGSRFPITIWWGEDFRLIYNDGYIPFLGTSKHPQALGQAGAHCWSEIWSDIGPMLEGVMRTGEARSEEHTSELQSQSNLVCRLLLEKKKKKTEA